MTDVLYVKWFPGIKEKWTNLSKLVQAQMKSHAEARERALQVQIEALLKEKNSIGGDVHAVNKSTSVSVQSSDDAGMRLGEWIDFNLLCE